MRREDQVSISRIIGLSLRDYVKRIQNFVTREELETTLKALRLTPGPQGERGERGERGADGKDGVGVPGAIGPKGDRGEKGDTGIAGPAGQQGERGERGEPGPQGDRGQDGLTVVGVQGAKGDKGDQGERGLPGERGQEGQRGEPGPQGERGAVGDRGAQGERGESGIPGKDGREGRDGKDGLNGRDAFELDILDGIDPAREYPRGTLAYDGGGIKRWNGTSWQVKSRGIDKIIPWQMSATDPRLFEEVKILTDGTVSKSALKFPIPLYRGVFRAGEYELADMVTHSGSMWYCRAEKTRAIPGKSDDWQLCVKQGQDGRNGTDGKQGPEGPQGPAGQDLRYK